MNGYEKWIEDLCNELRETLIKKNRDYKGSYVDTVNKYGPIVPLIRLNDKFSRLEQLILSNQSYIQDEKVEDTLLDLAGYSILELARRKHCEQE